MHYPQNVDKNVDITYYIIDIQIEGEEVDECVGNKSYRHESGPLETSAHCSMGGVLTSDKDTYRWRKYDNREQRIHIDAHVRCRTLQVQVSAVHHIGFFKARRLPQRDWPSTHSIYLDRTSTRSHLLTRRADLVDCRRQ